MTLLSTNANERPKITDFASAIILAQQAYEQGYRGATGEEFYKWIRSKIDLAVLANTAGLPETMPTPGSTLTTSTAGEWLILGPGTYNQAGQPAITVAANEFKIAQSNGTYYNKVVTIAAPKGADGKTIEVFNPAKVGGYAVGDSIYFPATGKKKTYLVTTATAMDESPDTHPTKFEVVGGEDEEVREFLNEYLFSPPIAVVNITGPVNLGTLTSRKLNIDNTIGTTTNATQRVIHNYNITTEKTLLYKVYEAYDNGTDDRQANIIGVKHDNSIEIILPGKASQRTYKEGSIDLTPYKTISLYWLSDLGSDGYFKFYEEYSINNLDNVLADLKNEINTNISNEYDWVNLFLEGYKNSSFNEVVNMSNGADFPYGTFVSNAVLLKNNTYQSGGGTNACLLRRIPKLDFVKLKYKVWRSFSSSNDGSTPDTQANIIAEKPDNTYDVIIEGRNVDREYVTGELDLTTYDRISLYWNINQNADGYFIFIRGDGSGVTLKQLLDELEGKSNQEKSIDVYRNANVISQFSTEKMTHCGMLFFDKRKNGKAFVSYVYDDVNISEGWNGQHKAGILCGNTCDLSKFERIELGGRGSEFGAFKIPTSTSKISIWEPFILDIGTGATCKYYAVADNENDTLGFRLVYWNFNKDTKTFEQNVNNCYLKYDGNTYLFNKDNINTMLATKTTGGRTIGGAGIMGMNDYVTIGGIHYVVTAGNANSLAGESNVHQGFILRTTDFITFEWVQELPVSSSITQWPETSVAAFNNMLYVVARRNTVYALYRYNPTTDEIIQVQITANVDNSRPKIVNYNGKLVVALNMTTDKITTSDGVLQRRSNLVLSEVNPDTLALTTIVSTQCKWGVHYIDIKRDRNDNWWMIYTSDRRYLSTTNIGNLELLNFDTLIKSKK